MEPSRNSIPADAAVSVIVPTQDAGALQRFRDAWETALAKTGRQFEFHLIENSHLGAALRTGLHESTNPLILIIVPSDAYRPSDLRLFFEGIDQADLVVGVRQGKTRSPIHQKWVAATHWVSRVVFGIDRGDPPVWYGFAKWRQNISWRFWYGLRAQDPECGLRLVRREFLNRCPIQSNGTFALVEMIAKINFAGGSIFEVTLGKPSDLPTTPPFANDSQDEKNVFRRPTFAPNKKPEEVLSSGSTDSPNLTALPEC